MMGYAVLIAAAIAVSVGLYCYWFAKKQRREARKKQAENLKQQKEDFLRNNAGHEYTILEQAEASLIGCPPIIRWQGKEFHPVVFVEHQADGWKLTLVRADIMDIEQIKGQGNSCLTVGHVKDSISAEEFDDMVKQLQYGIR